MSSLYHMVFGDGGFRRGAFLLPLVGFTSFEQTGRFRDCWLIRDGVGRLMVQLYTRNGGNNRTGYADVIDAMRASRLYQRDADDTFDTTFANFYFLVPVEELDATLAAKLTELAIDPVDTDQRWRDAVGAVDGPRDTSSVPDGDPPGVDHGN